MPITGGCLCRQLRYEITAEAPMAARVCWCRVCQYLGAGSGSANALFAKDSVKVTGDLKSYRTVADSGSVMRRSFCPICGTPIFSEAESRPHQIVVRTGTLDDPEIGRPIATIWTSAAPSWACLDPALPKGDGQSAPTK